MPLRLLTLFATAALATGFMPGAAPHGGAVVRAASSQVAMMAMPERFRKSKKGKKVKKEPTPSDVFGEVDIDAAAAEIEEALEVPEPPKPKASIKLPEVNVDADEVIVAAIKGSSTVFEKSKEALNAAKEFEEEHDVSSKAKDAFAMVVDFWKENEIGIKARAIGEIFVEEASKVDIKVPSKPTKAAKAPPTKAKAKFDMPTFEMPKFSKKK